MNNGKNTNSGLVVTEPDLSDLSSLSGNRRPPRVTIKSPTHPNGETVELDPGPTTLEAVARDLRDGDLSAQIEWSTTATLAEKYPDGILGEGASLEVMLPPGKQMLRARVIDSDGLIGFDSVAVLAGVPPIEKLESDTEEDETGGGG